jgi:hypothetical protein
VRADPIGVKPGSVINDQRLEGVVGLVDGNRNR